MFKRSSVAGPSTTHCGLPTRCYHGANGRTENLQPTCRRWSAVPSPRRKWSAGLAGKPTEHLGASVGMDSQRGVRGQISVSTASRQQRTLLPETSE